MPLRKRSLMKLLQSTRLPTLFSHFVNFGLRSFIIANFISCLKRFEGSFIETTLITYLYLQEDFHMFEIFDLFIHDKYLIKLNQYYVNPKNQSLPGTQKIF